MIKKQNALLQKVIETFGKVSGGGCGNTFGIHRNKDCRAI